MGRTGRWIAWAVLAGWIVGLGLLPVRADEDAEYYASELQNQGYADLATAYLEILVDRPDTPEELKERLDLLIGRALMVEASGADRETEAKLVQAAIARFKRFVATHRDSPKAIDGRHELANIELYEGQKLLARAEGANNPQDAATLREEARARFVQAGKETRDVVRRYREILRPLLEERKAAAPPPTSPRGRGRRAVDPVEEMISSVLFAELNLGLIEYFTGMSYPKGEERNEYLAAASDIFDRMYQRFRNARGDSREGVLGIYAHLWNGKTLAEMGQLEDALDIFDEILPREPTEPAEIAKLSRLQQDLFAQAYIFTYQVLNQKKEFDKVLSDEVIGGTFWMATHRNQQRARHGWGVRLEIARAKLGKLLSNKNVSKPEKARVFRELSRELNDIARNGIPPYQQQALKIRGEFSRELGVREGNYATFIEAFEAGNEALEEQDFEAAAEALGIALEKANRQTDPEQLAQARHRLAYAYLMLEELAKSADTAELILRETPRVRVAPEAGGVALVALFRLFENASGADKKVIFDRLIGLADRFEATYPNVRQADQSRTIRGSAYLAVGDSLKAGDAFAAVSDVSDEYAGRQLLAGQCYWRAYSAGKQQGKSKDDQAELLQKLQKVLREASSVSRDGLSLGSPAPPIAFEAELLLAESLNQTGAEAAEVGQLLFPLADQLETTPGVDRLAARTLVLAFQTAAQTGDLDRAGPWIDAAVAVEGGDGARVTAALIQFADKAEEESGNNANLAALHRRLLDRLAERPSQDYRSLNFLADRYARLEEWPLSAAQFGKLLALVETQPAALGDERKRPAELFRIRMRRAESLRRAGEYGEALTLLDGLLAEHEAAGKTTYPLRLEMEKASVLADWSKTDGEKLPPAVAQWNQIASRLQASATKPPEYFEARYQLAVLLDRQGRSDEAKKILVSTRSLYPDLGGPEISGKYETLLKKLSG